MTMTMIERSLSLQQNTSRECELGERLLEKWKCNFELKYE